MLCIIISVSSCCYGYHCRKGARGVSIVTTSTVVLSSILIILANCMITLMHA
nr:ABC transporter permease [Wolbachia endosymbiont of Mansonella ozzardi]